MRMFVEKKVWQWDKVNFAYGTPKDTSHSTFFQDSEWAFVFFDILLWGFY